MPLPQSQSKKIKRRYLIQLLSFLSLIASFLIIILLVDNLLVSFVLAFAIFYIFDPLVSYLERMGMRRGLSISIIFTVVGSLVAYLAHFLYPLLSIQLLTLQSELPKYIQGSMDLIRRFEARLDLLSGVFEKINLLEQSEIYLSNFTRSLFQDIPVILSKSLTTSVLAPFLAFFMLKDGPKLVKKLFNLVPNNLFELSFTLKHKINIQLGSFIRARFLESLIVGIIVWAGLWIINFKFAFLLALFAALVNLIPYVGPIIGMIPPVVMVLINTNDLVQLTAVLIPYLVAQVLDVFFIIPLVVAKIVDLHPVTVIISFIIGAEVMGVLGMFIAIPVASIIKVIILNVYQHLVGFHGIQ